MKVLIVGSGGRECALAWKLSQSEEISRLYCAPGNGGISKYAEIINISAVDFDGLAEFAEKEKIDLTVVGMDEPLVLGIVDAFESRGLSIFGPRKNAAILEGSKDFSKKFMERHNIPTAEYESFGNKNDAVEYLKNRAFPHVIKTDGLAAGKGAIICENFEEAEKTLEDIFDNKKFGDSGNIVVIEEFMTGTEVSILAFVDGKNVVPMISAQDHKRAFDGDKGPNTGGMGSIAPSKAYSDEIAKICMDKIFKPTVKGMLEEGREFKGIIFFGLMITDSGPKVIEYNARFGDPEAQVVLPMLENDLLEVIRACQKGSLDEIEIKWKTGAAACVIAASGGYPDSYEKGFEIYGLEDISGLENVIVFHAGTKFENGKFFTSGGRVLGVTAISDTLNEAVEKSYFYVNKVSFENMFFRKDIGKPQVSL